MRFQSNGNGLSRDPVNGYWLGVCAGIARAFGVEPMAIRIGFLILTLFLSPLVSLFVYGILALMMPKDGGWLDESRSDEQFIKDKIVVYGCLLGYVVLAGYLLSQPFK